MKTLLQSFIVIATRKDSLTVAIIAFVLLWLVLLGIQNGGGASDVLSLTSLPLMRRMSLFMSTFFDIHSTFTTSSLVLAILGSLLGGINISLAYTYMKLRGDVIVASGLYSGLGLVFAFLGIGCAACGTVLFGALFSFLGISSVFTLLPYHGEELGYIGFLVLCVATYSLSKKVIAPLVC